MTKAEAKAQLARLIAELEQPEDGAAASRMPTTRRARNPRLNGTDTECQTGSIRPYSAGAQRWIRPPAEAALPRVSAAPFPPVLFRSTKFTPGIAQANSAPNTREGV